MLPTSNGCHHLCVTVDVLPLLPKMLRNVNGFKILVDEANRKKKTCVVQYIYMIFYMCMPYRIAMDELLPLPSRHICCPANHACCLPK